MFTLRAKKQYFFLLILFLLMILLVIVINASNPSLINPTHSLLLTGGFALTAFISLLIFFNGQQLAPEKSVFMTLIALGVKMLLTFVLALLFVAVFKNNQTGSVILFFILYLAFTVFVFLTIFSVLKKRSV